MINIIQSKLPPERSGRIKGNSKNNVDQNKIKQEQVMLPKTVSTNSALSIKVNLG